MKGPAILSVDWDYFTDMSGEREHPLLYDWGHSEDHNPALYLIEST